jgi:hypothetical protein
MKRKETLNKAVISIDGVEYLIDELASRMIDKNAEEVVLTRLYDKNILVLSAEEINEIINKNGIEDYLD